MPSKLNERLPNQSKQKVDQEDDRYHGNEDSGDFGERLWQGNVANEPPQQPADEADDNQNKHSVNKTLARYQ